MSSNRGIANKFFIKKNSRKYNKLQKKRAEAAIRRQHKEKSKLQQQ